MLNAGARLTTKVARERLQASRGMRQQRGGSKSAADGTSMLDAAHQLLSPSRRSDVPPFIVMDVMAAAAAAEAQGRHIVHMEVGQPAQPAPLTARAAAQAALGGRIGYTESLGIPSLRARIARHYGESYGLDLDPSRVAVTTGSSGGFILAFLSLFDAGDRVALASPGYPPYRHILRRSAASRC
jgi:aspartate/methionine/tyrosine aminotransferase